MSVFEENETFRGSRRYKVMWLTGRASVRNTCTGVSHFKHVEQKCFELTVKLLVPGDECRPYTLAAVFHQVLKVQFALLVEVLLHLQRAAGVSLRTEAQVLTWRGGRIDGISSTAGGLAYLAFHPIAVIGQLASPSLSKTTRLEQMGKDNICQEPAISRNVEWLWYARACSSFWMSFYRGPRNVPFQPAGALVHIIWTCWKISKNTR